MPLRAVRLLLTVALWAANSAGAQAPPEPSPQACVPARTALVLSGGGSKGFAHIGVLQVLDSMGVKPDIIVGTSIGAIVGGLYASGYSARQVDSLLRALPLETIIRSYQPTVSASLGLLRPAAVWEKTSGGYALQTGAVREGEVNALLSSLMLRGNLIARGNFDSLPIPFRAVATDIVTRRAVVLGTGDLARAVRASASLPIVLRAVHMGKAWLTDGGLADNTPVWQARELGAERIWASRLPYAAPNPDTFDDPLALSSALINSLFREDTIMARYGDVSITNPTSDFENLDFSKATSDSLVRLGHETARAAFSSAACVMPLAQRSPQLPPIRVGRVTAGGTAMDGDAVIAGLGLIEGASVNAALLEKRLLEVGHSERYRGLWLNPSGSGLTASFAPELEAAPSRAIGVGVAFDQFMSGRIWIGAVDRSFMRANLEGALLARIGTYEQDVSGFIRRRTHVRRSFVPLTASAIFRHESVRLFKGSGELPNAETQELEGFIGMRDDPAPGRWRYDAGIDALLWREPARDTRGAVGVHASVFRARTEYEMSTLLEGIALTDFQRVRIDASELWGAGAVQLRLRLRAGWGNRLPIQQTFTLGGSDGFAGYRIGEIRGTQELFGSVLYRHRFAPLLHLRIEAMAGAVGRGNGVLVREDSTYYGETLAGIRAGVEAATPLGPIRVEEGFSKDGRRALLFRVGYWF